MVGVAQSILMQSKQVFAGAAPSKKVRTPGYLKMLIDNELPNIISSTVDNGTGHIKDVKIRYKPRLKTGMTSTTDDCSIQGNPSYLEATIPALSFRKYSLFLDDTVVNTYTEDASSTIMVGKPQTELMAEMWDNILDAANGLFGDINLDLLADQVAAFGVNAVTGTNAAVTLNFPLSTATANLTEGMPKLLNDSLMNETNVADMVLVGSGLISAYYMKNDANALIGSNGYDPNKLVLPGLYHDLYTGSAWGANQFGAFQKGSVRLINVNRFSGKFGGDKLTTILGTINLPVLDSLNGNQLRSFKFDFQLRYNPCPGDIEINGNTVSVGRGYILDLMANYAQMNIPGDAYMVGDPLYGNNGTYRYVATNA